MNIIIECHGASQRWCGASAVQIATPEPATVGDALALLAQRYPDFAERRGGIAVALGDTVVRTEMPLSEGMRLALIPPVSGG